MYIQLEIDRITRVENSGLNWQSVRVKMYLAKISTGKGDEKTFAKLIDYDSIDIRFLVLFHGLIPRCR